LEIRPVKLYQELTVLNWKIYGYVVMF